MNQTMEKDLQMRHFNIVMRNFIAFQPQNPPFPIIAPNFKWKSHDITVGKDGFLIHDSVHDKPQKEAKNH